MSIGAWIPKHELADRGAKRPLMDSQNAFELCPRSRENEYVGATEVAV